MLAHTQKTVSIENFLVRKKRVERKLNFAKRHCTGCENDVSPGQLAKNKQRRKFYDKSLSFLGNWNVPWNVHSNKLSLYLWHRLMPAINDACFLGIASFRALRLRIKLPSKCLVYSKLQSLYPQRKCIQLLRLPINRFSSSAFQLLLCFASASARCNFLSSTHRAVVWFQIIRSRVIWTISGLSSLLSPLDMQQRHHN